MRGQLRHVERGNNEAMDKNVELQPKTVTRLLLEAVAEARRGAALISQATGLVSMTNPQLRETAAAFERIAIQTQLLATRVDHDRAPYNKNFSDFVRQIGRLVKSGRADAEVSDAVAELQLGARSIWNDLRRIEDNIKNPEYYYLGPNYQPGK